MRDAASARNAGFIRQVCNRRGLLPDKSGVPVMVSNCAPLHRPATKGRVAQMERSEGVPPAAAKIANERTKFHGFWVVERAAIETAALRRRQNDLGDMFSTCARIAPARNQWHCNCAWTVIRRGQIKRTHQPAGIYEIIKHQHLIGSCGFGHHLDLLCDPVAGVSQHGQYRPGNSIV